MEVIYLNAADLPPMVSERAVGKKTLFFCNSRARTEKVAMAIKKRETSVFVHHSSISKEEREKAEEAITHGSNVCIVCTSTLELGIDVGELDRILQEECPSTVASFLQRMGRTGRRPNTRANTTFFTTHKETLLQAIALIELARSHWVENISLNHWSWHILVQQIMAMCLQFGAATRWHIWDTIHLAACFSKISEQSFHDLIDYMIGLDFLQEESGRLSMGREAEKTFGAKNFKELYAVFSSPAAYKVLTIGGQSLGTIEWQFADQMELPCCFRLDGSGWLVERLEHQSRTVYVTKATTNKTPTWGGYAPNILSYEICRQIFRIQTCDDDYPYCDPAAQEALNEIRQEKAFFRGHFAPLQVEDNYLHWWTFAGNRINTTLKLAISFLKETKIVSNNYALTMLFIHDPPHTINQILLEITQPAFWENQEFTQYLLDHLPMYRFSKFQPCLPESFQYQLIAQELLDIKGTAAFLVQFHKHAGVKRGRRP
jgi:ATP-dependent Lhr-like helicase